MMLDFIFLSIRLRRVSHPSGVCWGHGKKRTHELLPAFEVRLSVLRRHGEEKRRRKRVRVSNLRMYLHLTTPTVAIV